ncbi:hypothetical protein HUO13_09950 [Saccharopolyspora erythraea]|uniref:hypothetical protein n=1 Tax=Saccharopolyspora erythraea TaxID=1836 RepID=UPI001BAB6D6C|nr:hypothetical protein [Saccharopolyspora erythraea]QUH01100.1 hypothetical protein HUO13_09950 [Saccharopolyspora erythraea]
MTPPDDTREEALLRAQLHRLVDDVEPRGDALPKLLAAARRRRSPRRPLFLAAGAAVAATAVFLVALLSLPSNRTEPASVQPNSYLAVPGRGVIAAFDVVSGRQVREVATIDGEPAEALATDRERIYAIVATGPHRRIVEISADGGQRVVTEALLHSPVLAAGGGHVAYLDGPAVVVRGGAERRLPLPRGERVLDLALASDGRLAVLTTREGSQAGLIRIVAPDAVSLTEQPGIAAAGACGPLAIAWSGQELAALRPTDCGSGRARVTTLDSRSGEQIGAGAPFDTGPFDGEDVQLSVDRLGRFLISVAGQRQWLVDGSDVRALPPACAPAGQCAVVPATFWG